MLSTRTPSRDISRPDGLWHLILDSIASERPGQSLPLTSLEALVAARDNRDVIGAAIRDHAGVPTPQ
jgi:hypothetical protein